MVVSTLPVKKLFLVLILTSTESLHAATLVTNGTTSDILAKLATANPGDTLTIPAGDFEWTQLKIPPGAAKAITLKGAGSGSSGTHVHSAAARTSIISMTLPASGRFNIQDIDFDGANRSGVLFVNHTGSTTRLRVHHCVIRNSSDRTFWIYSDGQVLVDHCTFIDCWTCFGTFGANQDAIWNGSPGLGTAYGVVVEDCHIKYIKSAGGHPLNSYFATSEGTTGKRFIFRHNTWSDDIPLVHGFQAFDQHGNADSIHTNGNRTTSAHGGLRGARTFECYDNTFTSNGPPETFSQFLDLRGGYAAIYNNTFWYKNVPFFFKVREEDGTGAVSTYGCHPRNAAAWSGETTYLPDPNDNGAGPPFDRIHAYFGPNNTMGKTSSETGTPASEPILNQRSSVTFGYKRESTATARLLNNVCTLVAGSTTITTRDKSFSKADVGQPIEANGIPANTTIIAVTNSATATMSAPAGASRTSDGIASFRVAIGTREDAFFIKDDRDIFYNATRPGPPGYKALPYPHPFITEDASSENRHRH